MQIRQRESLSDELTTRIQGGNFNTWRGFAAYSPNVQKVDSYLAYEGSYTDGPFINPGRYRRDNVNGNFATTLPGRQKLGFRLLYGRNDFYSSGKSRSIRSPRAFSTDLDTSIRATEARFGWARHRATTSSRSPAETCSVPTVS